MPSERNSPDVQRVDEVGRVNRLYAVLSKVNEAIVRIHDPQELYEAACKIAVEDGHFLLAWIGFVEPGTQLIRWVAKCGRDDGYLDTISISLDEDTPQGRGPTGMSLREGRAFVNNDTANNPVMRPWRDEQLKRGYKSSASFPLQTEGKTIGVITLYAGEPDYFDHEEVRLLECLADDFSFALESAEIARQRESAEDALQESRAELEVRVAEVTAAFEDLIEQRTEQATYAEALNRINDSVHSTLDFEEIMKRAVIEIAGALDVDAVVVQVHKEDHWEFEYSHGLPEELRFVRLPNEQVPLSMEVLRTRAPLVVDDVAADGRVNVRTMERFGITALMAAPLIVRGEVFGVLLADRFGEPAPFSEQQVDFLQKAAATLALGLENARLFDEQETRAQRMSVLKELAEIGATSFSVKDVADRLTDAVITLLGASNAVVALSEGGRLDPVAIVGYPEDFVEKLTPLPEDSLAAQAFHSGEGHFVNDYETADVSEFTRTTSRALGFGSYAALPLMSAGSPVGAVGFVWREVRQFDPDEVSFLSAVVSEAALGMQNAKLFEAERESSRLSEALNTVNAAVHSTLEINMVMWQALDAGVNALECDAGTIEMLEGDEWVVRYQRGFSEQVIGTRLSRDDAPNATRAARQGRPLAIETMLGDEKVYVGFVKQHHLKSVLVVPLIAMGEVIGCVLFYTSATVRRFTDAEIDFGRKLGSVVSLGLQNARLYGAEHRIAETLQQALLSLPDHLPGIEFSPYYRSATESTLVGGDFYDIFELDDRDIGITIGDIAGKGLDAAVLTSLVRNTIRAHALEKGKSPAEILRLANDIVVKSTPAEAFATVFFGILDRQDGRLVYASAGHTTSAIVGQDDTLSPLSATGPLLGVFAGIEFDQRDACLGRHEILFLYTDGLTEARRDAEFYGEERLFAELISAKHTSARAVAENVVASVMSFSGNHLRDDLAILAVKRLES